MTYEKMREKTMEIMEEIRKEAASFDPDSVYHRIAMDEVAHCKRLLDGGFNITDVKYVMGCTTSGKLHGLMKDFLPTNY